MYVAVSGGPDSMAALDFLRTGNRDVRAVYIHHGTEFGTKCLNFVKDYCEGKRVPFMWFGISGTKPKSQSLEEYWSIERHKLLNNRAGKVVMAHHLDDVAESWVWSSLHGQPKLINRIRGNVVRPFLLTRKKALVSWCERKDVPYLEDPSNEDTNFIRNHIRHNLIPMALKVNPGLHTMLAKKLKRREKENHEG